MRALVVQMHPVPESFNSAVLEAALDGLRSVPVEVTVARLGAGDSFDAADLDAIDALVVIAPTWWGGPPAQLLERLQTLLAPWAEGSEPRATSPLRTVRRLVVATTHGSSRLINTLQGEPGRRLWQRVVLPLCAADARFEWVALYKIDRLDEAGRVAYLDRVRREVPKLVTSV